VPTVDVKLVDVVKKFGETVAVDHIDLEVAGRRSITVTTTITMLIGRSTGKMTERNVRHSLAPSMAAASRSERSTAFSPAR